MNSSESTAAISESLVIALAGLENPPKTQRVNAGRMNYSFAPLPDILDNVRPILATSGLALVMEAVTSDGRVGATARLVHASGEWIEFGPLLLPAGGDAQAAGSAITYARRYLLCAVLNIAADEDDDGAKAKKSAAKKPKEDWGTKVEAPKNSESEGNLGEGPTGSEPTSSDGDGDGTTVIASPPSGGSTSEEGPVSEPAVVVATPADPAPPADDLDDDPAAPWRWKDAAALGITGPQALKRVRATFGKDRMSEAPNFQTEITNRQLAAVIKEGKK